ncbi:Hypothetical predicted protein [Olea europaea subsp. europaea]|uniref:Secreted protein n=1 Tax=Olea europaea subsp. europaea TaxID=158383 RepID=A0A8S0VIB9_OLEEU|nr:Hypothetical predicted protein [Olea europaea subsp. europaea]
MNERSLQIHVLHMLWADVAWCATRTAGAAQQQLEQQQQQQQHRIRVLYKLRGVLTRELDEILGPRQAADERPARLTICIRA